jgi:quercetin dioxygenase-like cupin family protein
MSEIPFLPKTETATAIIHSPGDGQKVGVIGGQSTFKVLPNETGGVYTVLEQEIPAGSGPPLHVHRHETEIFYILKGQFELFINGKWIPAPQGTCATCPRDIPHTFRNVGTTPGRLLLTIIPGRFGNYFIEIDQEPNPDVATMKALCAQYDVEFIDG